MPNSALNRTAARSRVSRLLHVSVKKISTVQFDAERVNRVMERVARGLFFHDFGHRWACELRVLADGPLMSDLSPSPYRQVIRRLEPTFIHSPRKGMNPSIFWYQWVAGVGGDRTHILRMCFIMALNTTCCLGSEWLRVR